MIRVNRAISSRGFRSPTSGVSPERVDGPGDPLLQARVGTGTPALAAVGVETAQLGAGHDRVGLVEDDRGGLELVEEAVSAGVDDILGGDAPAVLGVGRGEQVIGPVAVGVLVVHVGIARLGEIDRGEDREGVVQVAVLEVQEFAVEFFGEGEIVGGLDGGVGLEVAGGGVGNAQQVVAGGIAEIGHRRRAAAQDQRERGLDGNAREGLRMGQAGFEHRPVKNPVLGRVVIGDAILPVNLRIEMRTRLAGVADAVDQSEVAGVVNRREIFQ